MNFQKRHWTQWIYVAMNITSSVIPRVWQRVVISMAFSLTVTIIYESGPAWIDQPSLASLIPSVVLGLLLVFRTNTSYDRFWEGRKLIGGIIISGRSLSRQLWANIPEKTPKDTEEKKAIMLLIAGFLISSKLHLRKEDIDQQLESIITTSQCLELKEVSHIPLRITKWIGDYLHKLYNTNYIDSIQLAQYNQILDKMVADETGCERILNTPIPLAYAIHLRHLLFLYCFVLPFQLVADLHWITAPAVGIISFALFGIEAIGLEIENPFGYDPNDLPLDNLCNRLLFDIQELLNSDSPKEYLV